MHPQVAALIDELVAMGLPSSRTLPLPDGRENLARLLAPLTTSVEVHEVRDLTIDGASGPIEARLYRPSSRVPLTVLVYLHGGGWVFGDIDTHDGLCRQLANAAGCVVVSVGYRRAPEAKFPEPIEDCVAAIDWIVGHAERFGFDVARLAVGGDSAGGNLAAAAALVLKDRGDSPIGFQLLFFPNTDATMCSASMREFADDPFLSRDEISWSWDQYLPHETDRRHPLVSPLHAPDLSGLPPALIITAEIDPLRDEGEAYARRLEEAGVPVKCRRFDGMVHGFVAMNGKLDVGRQAIAEAGAALAGGFER